MKSTADDVYFLPWRDGGEGRSASSPDENEWKSSERLHPATDSTSLPINKKGDEFSTLTLATRIVKYHTETTAINETVATKVSGFI